MSSGSGIPNLNTLRRGIRGRGRGSHRDAESSQISRDTVIRSTDDDAATSRISAIDAGYLHDPFARYLTTETWQRRLPLMNRGTYTRTTGIDKIVDTFLSTTTERRQIISLGAGSDTRFLRLRHKKPKIDLIYHELDFEDNNKRKVQRLRSLPCSKIIKELCDFDVSLSDMTESTLKSKDYCIHSIDLRGLTQKGLPIEIKTELPTLIISECCLVYLSPEDADQVLICLSNAFSSTPLAVVIYEPIHPNDSFGKTMIRNLVSRGIHLQTIEKYANLDAQRRRLSACGFTSRAQDINYIWQNWISQDEKDRVDKLEWMDEVEEFILLAEHYCLSWGWRSYQDDSLWSALPTSAHRDEDSVLDPG